MTDTVRRSDADGRRTLAALAHPIRVGMLAHLRTHRSASPRELADVLRLALGTASYHVRRLDNLGLIELVERRQRRGAIQHYYGLTRAAAGNDVVRQVTDMATMHPEASRASTRALLDATAIGDLREDLRRLFARMHDLEAETVRRGGVNGHAPAFVVDVSCVMDVERNDD